MAKIIGVEVKASLETGENAELAMFGCQIPIPALGNYNQYGAQISFEVTLHTTEGDVTLRQGNRGSSDPAKAFYHGDDERTGQTNPLQRVANVLHP